MIDIAELNRQLVEQDEQLRATLAAHVELLDDCSLRTIASLVAEGLAALHERQGNLIVLMLQSAS